MYYLLDLGCLRCVWRDAAPDILILRKKFNEHDYWNLPNHDFDMKIHPNTHSQLSPRHPSSMKTTLKRSSQTSSPSLPKRAYSQSATILEPIRPNSLRKRRVNQTFDLLSARWPEMTQYAHDAESHELRIFSWKPSEKVIASVVSGLVKIGFEDYEDLCYLTSQLTVRGKFYRTPIAHWLLPIPRCPLPKAGSPLRIILIDAADGTIKAISNYEFQSSVADRLHQLLSEQAQGPAGYLMMDAQLRKTRSGCMSGKALQRSRRDKAGL